MHIKFVDDIDVPRRKGKYEAFFNALRDNPGRWAEFPAQGTSGTRGGTAHHIKKGTYSGIERGEFDALSRNGVLYVRFVGGDA